MVVAAAARAVADGFAARRSVPARSLGQNRRRLRGRELLSTESRMARFGTRARARDPGFDGARAFNG